MISSQNGRSKPKEIGLPDGTYHIRCKSSEEYLTRTLYWDSNTFAYKHYISKRNGFIGTTSGEIELNTRNGIVSFRHVCTDRYMVVNPQNDSQLSFHEYFGPYSEFGEIHTAFELIPPIKNADASAGYVIYSVEKQCYVRVHSNKLLANESDISKATVFIFVPRLLISNLFVYH